MTKPETVLAAAWRDDCVCAFRGGAYVYPCGYEVLEDVAGLRPTAGGARDIARDHAAMHRERVAA